MFVSSVMLHAIVMNEVGDEVWGRSKNFNNVMEKTQNSKKSPTELNYIQWAIRRIKVKSN